MRVWKEQRANKGHKKDKYKAKRRKKYAQATESKRISKEQRNEEIKALKQQGYTNKQLMEIYGLSKRTIQYITNNQGGCNFFVSSIKGGTLGPPETKLLRNKKEVVKAWKIND